MYKVLIDGFVAYKPGSKSYSLTKAQLDLETGFAAKFEFTIPPVNPMATRIKNLTSIVQVFRDDKEIFYGSVRNMKGQDRFKNRTYEALSAMSWLSDSVQPQAEYHDQTVRQFLESLISEHNAKVDAPKKFEVGAVTITDSNDSLYRFTNFEDTLSCIRDKLVDRLGGVLRVRHEGTKNFLDYISIDEFGVHSTQPIEFGLNLLDYSETLTADDIVTALIPLGATIEDEAGEDSDVNMDKRVNIKEVNSNKDYLLNAAAISTFGKIWAVVTWDDVTDPSNLKRKGQEYLTDKQYELLTLTLKAADLSALGQDYGAFNEGDLITCRAKPYGMNTVLPVRNLSINILDPTGNELTLSKQKKASYTSSNEKKRGQASVKLDEVRRIQTSKLRSEIDAMTAIMTGSKGGYKVTEYDDEGRWLRDLYLNTPDRDTATRVLQINKDGIAGSTNGIEGPYTVGLTIDGKILGQSIAAGTISTEQLSAEYKAEVTREIDGKLSNYVTQAKLTVDLNGINAEVSKKVGSSEIISKINQSAESLKISASKVSIDASTFRVQATKLSWKSTYSELSESGVLKCQSAKLKGTMRCGSTSGYWLEMSSGGKLTGGYGSAQYGYIDCSGSMYDIEDPSQTWNGIQLQGGCLRISTSVISVSNSTNTNVTSTRGYTGSCRIVYDMASDMSSCSSGTLRFINGICTTCP